MDTPCCPGVSHRFGVTATLTMTSGLSSGKIVSGAYVLYYLRKDPTFGVWIHLGVAECCILFSGHFDLDLCPQF